MSLSPLFDNVDQLHWNGPGPRRSSLPMFPDSTCEVQLSSFRSWAQLCTCSHEVYLLRTAASVVANDQPRFPRPGTIRPEHYRDGTTRVGPNARLASIGCGEVIAIWPANGDLEKVQRRASEVRQSHTLGWTSRAHELVSER